MAIHFEHIDIKCFRGLNQVEISGLRDVNIIAGDNNSGKTSFMEALCLFRKPADFYNVLKVARMRDVSPFTSPAIYENFISLFPKDEMYIGVHATGEIGESVMEIHGEEQKELFSVEMMLPYNRMKHIRESRPDVAQEIMSFYGEMYGHDEHSSFHDSIRFNPFMKTSELSFRNRRYPDSINIVYLSPLAHMQGNGAVKKAPKIKRNLERGSVFDIM